MHSSLWKVAYFWSLWSDFRKHGGKWRELTAHFDKHPTNFANALKVIKNIVWNRCNDLFSQTNPEEYEQQILTKTIKKQEWIRRKNIKVILYDEFKNYPALKYIDGNPHFFFYLGDETILNFDSTNFVSVVGSRKTPDCYKAWIQAVVPRNKIIVSGLANGADTMAHLWTVKNHQKIVVLPGIDLAYGPKNGPKKQIWDYAIKNGLIMSDLFPGSKNFSTTVFLKRNKWMARMVADTFVVYFQGRSGTLGQVLEFAKLTSKKQGGQVYMPSEVFQNNLEFLKSHYAFKKIIPFIRARDI